jgi:hypothetical protein
VTGTPVNFGGMTGRALAVILKLNFGKSCNHKKSFLLAPKPETLWGTLYIARVYGLVPALTPGRTRARAGLDWARWG